MKIITIEEQFQIAEIKKAVAKYFPGQSASHLLGYSPPDAPLEDVGTGRLQRMDAMGIDVQVLSYTPAGLPAIPAAEAVPLAKEIYMARCKLEHTPRSCFPLRKETVRSV